jgi:hypothetical protein
VKTTSTVARRLLREGNPVPDDAFPDAARDAGGQALLAAILATPPVTAADTRRPRWRAAAPLRRPAIRTWKVAVPAVAMTAALAGLLAVMLSATGGPQPRVASQPPGSGFASLIANLTVHPSGHSGDAAAVFRQLAAAAARQPAVPLGPVEYSEIKQWGLDLGTLHYDLSYVSHETQTDRAWVGRDGSYLWYYTFPAGTKIDPGLTRLQQGGPSPAAKARFAWRDPAKLPVDIAALRRHLIAGYVAPPGSAPTIPGLSPDQVAQAIVTGSYTLMAGEPLPPAVRASLLRVLADSAAQGLANAHFINMGTVTDRAGHAGVAIGYEIPDRGGVPGTQTRLEVLVFDPATGALLGLEWAYCTAPASSYPAAGSCTPSFYDQILQVKAVQTIPAPPKLPPAAAGQTLTTPPQASASQAPTPQSSLQSGSNP